MSSANKRRAGTAASPDFSTPDPVKRRKKNDDTFFPDEETHQTTTEIGLKLMRQLKKSQDKTGRNVAGHFLELPDKKQYPDYYAQVRMPISLNMVEKRLEKEEYETMEKLESDLKRLVQNAKEYNSTKSEIYDDAERIRKALSNFMPKHNPAYLNPNYRAYPTPLPQEEQKNGISTPMTNGHSSNLKITLTNRRASMPASATEDDGPDDDMIEKQLEVVDELMEQPNAENFWEKPSKRQYPEYYRMIAKPTALADVRKVVEKGRISSWDAFIEEIRLIWDNAKDFNEEGSVIFDIAETLETYFEDKINELGVAPKKVKLTVKQPTEPPKIKLKLGGTPASTPGPSGMSVDQEALRRQKEETSQALGRAQSRDRKPAMIPVAALNGQRSMPGAATPGAESVAKADVNRATGDPSKLSTMADAQRTPSVLPPQLQPAQYTQPATTYAQSSAFKAAMEKDSPIDRIMRDPGKGLESALLSSVTFMTCPRMPQDPQWKVTRHASATMTQTATYTFLPSDHYYLRIIPRLSDELKRRKKHKLVVCRNWEILAPQAEKDEAGREVFDFRIHPGENNIIVDVIADLREGERKDYAPQQLQVDFERCQMIVMLRDLTPE